MREQALLQAEAIRADRYPDAGAFFLGGSIMRGEGWDHSDLDIVVIFDHLPAAYRESFLHEGRPVEIFVHDPATLAYFFHHVDRPSGVPSLPAMVWEGVELPAPNALSARLKGLALAVLQAGPPPWEPRAVSDSRYRITCLVDDLRDARPGAQRVAAGADLYAALATHVFRSRGLWSATGKAIPGRLQVLSPQLAQRFETGFAELFESGDSTGVIALAEDVLRPQGGWLFDGYRSDAPGDWRMERPDA